MSSNSTQSGHHTHGGRRPGAGRPQQRIHLSLEAANLLRELVRLTIASARHSDVPDFTITPDEAVEDLIYSRVMALRDRQPETRERWLAIERGEEP